MTKLTLISSPTCPYVQRAIIALKEKGAAFDVIYVDLANRPDWFAGVSPLGKVPVLKVERPGLPEAVIFESSVIVEYLEETAPGPKLHPADPLEKAQHRAWMEFGSSLLTDLFRMGAAKTEDDYAPLRAAALQKLQRVESILGEGPFFAGPAFSCVDAVFAPAFRQIDTFESVAHSGLLDGLPKTKAWSQALAARPSVQQAAPADYAERFIARFNVLGSHMMKAAA
jgi:glutathione S-transferase